ncbi:helix-turn-helix transcriptional regulator [Rhizobium sp. ERR 1071]|uniref:helix-turn-helix transcriptional regulator n=1 Tax=Rhizobium sp. ERR 1071 TaxID=2572677 RepID=UPI0011A86F2B|nr:AlpA family phage regulatory protein [Rhizobium sp. ERR1071]
MDITNDNVPDRLLNLAAVKQITSLGTSTIYRRMGAGTFPKPLQLSEACVRWRESEIANWINSLPIAA